MAEAATAAMRAGAKPAKRLLKGFLGERLKKIRRVRIITYKKIFKEIVFMKNPNLVQLLGKTPNKGIDYLAWRPTWPPNIHYQISKTQFFVIRK